MRWIILLTFVFFTHLTAFSQEKTSSGKKNEQQNSLNMKSEFPDNYHPAFDNEESLSYGCPRDNPGYTAEFFQN
jgi:hypothetical protein